MSDIMDEFEFKPLTEGLGFHKKKEAKAEQKSGPHAAETFANSKVGGADFIDLTSPLPRPQNPSKIEPQPIAKKNSDHKIPSTTVDEILKTLQDKKRPEFAKTSEKTKIDASPEPAKYKKTAWDFSAFCWI